METLLMLAVRVLLFNAFGWIWQCCNTDGAPGEFKITPSAWGWSTLVTVLSYGASNGSFVGDGSEMRTVTDNQSC